MPVKARYRARPLPSGRQRRVFDAPRCAEKPAHQGRLQRRRPLDEQHQREGRAEGRGADIL